MGFRTCIVFLAIFITVISAQYTPQNQQQSAQSPDNSPASANIQYRARPYNNQYNNNQDDDDDDEEDEAPAAAYQQQQRRPLPNQFRKPISLKQQEEEEELEEEEPDRLSLLLEKSSFNCNGHTTGYYADEGLGCEVFHYCQENQKHSWICPEGFTFHQVHLICMPPSSENICDQSSKYHFVNEYLYKPLNMEEHQARPNISLRYSERYYPESFYLDERHQDNEPYQSAPQIQSQYHQEQRQRQPIQVGLRKPTAAPQQIQYRLPSTTATPYRAPPTSTPQPYRTPLLTSTPSQLHQQQQQQQQAQQNAYRSPEDINISLQQRRPILFTSPTTHSYASNEDQEYNYEK